jgi:hypothetical protein
VDLVSKTDTNPLTIMKSAPLEQDRERLRQHPAYKTTPDHETNGRFIVPGWPAKVITVQSKSACSHLAPVVRR